jgi:WbqC-like protein family
LSNYEADIRNKIKFAIVVACQEILLLNPFWECKGSDLTTLVVLQPSYLPWLGYFDQMRKADVFVWCDDVQFDKHGWRNRNRIKGPQGPLWLTVPVRHKGRALQPINAVEIDSHLSWSRKHLRSVEQLYARAPFTAPVLAQLTDILLRPWERLVDLNIATTEWLAKEFAIKTPLHRTSQLGIEGDRNGRLINLCRHFQATRYISGDAARNYLDVARFAAAGIEVAWHSYQHPQYPQLHGDFLPYLSALDLLLNVGPTANTFFLK